MSDSVPLSEINLEVKDTEKVNPDDKLMLPIYYKTLPAGGLKNVRSDNAHNLSSENTMKDNCGNIVHLRRKPRVQKSRLKRRCSINGHYYNREVSLRRIYCPTLIFIPVVIDSAIIIYFCCIKMVHKFHFSHFKKH